MSIYLPQSRQFNASLVIIIVHQRNMHPMQIPNNHACIYKNYVYYVKYVDMVKDVSVYMPYSHAVKVNENKAKAHTVSTKKSDSQPAEQLYHW